MATHSELLHRFEFHLLVEQSFTPKTAGRYRLWVSRWLAWCSARRIHATEATPEHASRWWATLVDPGSNRRRYSAASLAHALSSVRTFHEWLIDDGKATQNPFARIRRPPVRYRLQPRLSEEEMERLLRAVPEDDDPRALRDRALLLTFYSTAGRLSEVVGIDLDDLDLENQRVRLRGKGGRERWGLLAPPAIAAIERWLVAGRPLIPGVPPHSGPLFVGIRGRRLCLQSAYEGIRRAARRAGILKPVSPHTLRRSAATIMWERGARLEAIQEYLGHQKLETTRQHYVAVEAAKARADWLRAHPLAAAGTNGLALAAPSEDEILRRLAALVASMLRQ